ncbi:MAG TPA: hypothetical protein VG897_11105 [Terriglobales bacterium]|nr:hypothetical protein [Terriglobales bacterium]
MKTTNRRVQEGVSVVPQTVLWVSTTPEGPAGIRVWAADGIEQPFVPWADLKSSLETYLLPMLFADPYGYSFETHDHHAKKDWLVQVLNGAGEVHGELWFGNDPDAGFGFDGLIRVGDSNVPMGGRTWQTYQRYSDGSFRRRKSGGHPSIDMLAWTGHS